MAIKLNSIIVWWNGNKLSEQVSPKDVKGGNVCLYPCVLFCLCFQSEGTVFEFEVYKNLLRMKCFASNCQSLEDFMLNRMTDWESPSEIQCQPVKA